MEGNHRNALEQELGLSESDEFSNQEALPPYSPPSYNLRLILHEDDSGSADASESAPPEDGMQQKSQTDPIDVPEPYSHNTEEDPHSSRVNELWNAIYKELGIVWAEASKDISKGLAEGIENIKKELEVAYADTSNDISKAMSDTAIEIQKAKLEVSKTLVDVKSEISKAINEISSNVPFLNAEAHQVESEIIRDLEANRDENEKGNSND